jgi:hypothetical protein
MKTSVALLTLILIASVSSLNALAQSDDKAVIDKYIAGQAAKQQGEEPDGVRKMVEGDLNRDGVGDVAVLYTIEGQNGSNNYVQYVAVFLRKNGKLMFAARAAAGGKNRRAIEITSIKNNAMLFDTTAYGPRDPSCCPTLKGHTKYVLVGNRLVEKRQK